MNDNTIDDRMSVYEVSYLVSTKISLEKIALEAEKVKKIITDAGSEVIGEEIPHLEQLAYTIRMKTVAGSYEKNAEAYFGWIKFEVSTSKIESIKKAIETMSSIIRVLVITTVRENTYLGKRASAIAAAMNTRKSGFEIERIPERTPEKVVPRYTPIVTEEAAVPATIEEMDKSIDEMVKEV
jgi:ribosomal protein S6